MSETVWTSCNACGADAFEELSTVDGWHIGRCSQCSLIYVNPIPFFEPSEDFSEQSLDFQYTRYMHGTIGPEILQFEREQLRRQLAMISQNNGNGFHATRLLEMGCGSGASVRAAVDIGLEAIGVDLDPKLIATGRNQLNVDLRCSTLLTTGLKGESFQYIRLRDVIEHLPNPYDILLEVKRLLVPGGAALIVTPNEDRLPNRARLMLGRRITTVAAVPPPHHLHGFTSHTLRRIFERVGFEIDSIKTTTPFDPLMVTSNNMRATQNKLHVMGWLAGQAIGKGSVLYGWVRKPK